MLVSPGRMLTKQAAWPLSQAALIHDLTRGSLSGARGSGIAHTRGTAANYLDASAVQQSAATNEAIFEYDANGVPLGFRMEGSGENLVLHSQDASNWTPVNSPTVTTNSTVAPDGTTTADTIDDENGAGNAHIARNVTVADDSVTRVYYCMVLKTSGDSHYSSLSLSYAGGTTKTAYIVVNSNTGAISATSGTIEDSGVLDYGNYWIFWYAVANNNLGNTTLTLRFYPAVNTDGGAAFAAATTGSKVWWGANVEVGDFPTSYLATTTGTTTRDPDVAAFSNINFITDPTVFTMFVWGRTYGSAVTQRILHISDGAASAAEAHILDIITTGEFRYQQNSGGATKFQIDGGTVAERERFCLAFRCKSGDNGLWVNGTKINSDANADLPESLTAGLLGRNHVGTSRLYGHLDRIECYGDMSDANIVAHGNV